MSDQTCLYNQVHGFFNRREIRMLAEALGLPEERINDRLDKYEMPETLRTSQLLDLIERGAFASDINRMYNSHGGRYNSVVFAKALQLIDGHLFSFNEILKARLAFNIYEMNVSSNDQNNLELINRTIKFCDYRVSTLKLKNHLQHYRLNTSRKLHLCEYFDLLLICNRENNATAKPTKRIIDLTDPKPDDQKMMEELNAKYLRDEHNWFFQEQFFKHKTIENSVWPAQLIHRQQTSSASIRKAQIQRQLSASITSLKQSRAGSACSSRSHIRSSSLQRSRPVSHCSYASVTPIATRNSICSSTPSETPETDVKSIDKPDRMQELQSEAVFIAIKYALHREDYMDELLPRGYSKPVIISKPILQRRKKPRIPLHWSRRATVTKCS